MSTFAALTILKYVQFKMQPELWDPEGFVKNQAGQSVGYLAEDAYRFGFENRIDREARLRRVTNEERALALTTYGEALRYIGQTAPSLEGYELGQTALRWAIETLAKEEIVKPDEQGDLPPRSVQLRREYRYLGETYTGNDEEFNRIRDAKMREIALAEFDEELARLPSDFHVTEVNELHFQVTLPGTYFKQRGMAGRRQPLIYPDRADFVIDLHIAEEGSYHIPLFATDGGRGAAYVARDYVYVIDDLVPTPGLEILLLLIAETSARIAHGMEVNPPELAAKLEMILEDFADYSDPALRERKVKAAGSLANHRMLTADGWNWDSDSYHKLVNGRRYFINWDENEGLRLLDFGVGLARREAVRLTSLEEIHETLARWTGNEETEN